MRIVHVAPTLGADYGGPARSVPALCSGLAGLGPEVAIVTPSTTRVFGPALQPQSRRVAVRTVPAFASGRLRVIWAPLLGRTIAREIEGPEVVVHAHGIWLPSTHSACRVAGAHGVPYVVSPRGMVSSWSMSYRRWKKQIAWQLYQRHDLRRAALLHATADSEADDLRRLGFRQPIAVIPNGTDLPPPRVHRQRTTRTALFLSRIHPKKGLVNLVRAWAQAGPYGWRLVIIGPDEEGYRSVIEREIRDAGVASDIEIRPPVDGDAKWDAYASADLFVLPTFSENFGIAVSEALASGVPVITTHGAPWRDLVTHACGWWIPIGIEPLAVALRDATALGDEEREAMGVRGRRLIAERYGWAGVAQSMLDVYRWLLDGGAPPATIR